jgi:cation diffusion facilitator CzcD-associated flavoprotein CzcO
VTDQLDVAVVGAGPFGLSVAACLPRRKVRVFGEPMKTWATTMPSDMLLRSAWSETSLAAPGGAGSILDWAAGEAISTMGPIPLQTFLAYAEWFRARYVPDLDPSDIETVRREKRTFVLTTRSGDTLTARRVVLAVGVTPFPYAPPQLASLDDARVRFSIDIQGFEQFRGRRVVVVGGGQAGLESAGLAARAGAEVELVCRSPIRWFADREPDRPRSPLRQRLYRLAYPAVGYGPPPLNRLVLHPDLFARLPATAKQRLSARLLRPGGSPWLRSLVDGRVRITESRTIRDVVPGADALRITIDDGSQRLADDVLVATGYRFDLGRLTFLDPAIAAAVATNRGWPTLDRYFRSSDRDLFFVGYPAEGRFGPISRFVLGTGFTANRVAEALREL